MKIVAHFWFFSFPAYFGFTPKGALQNAKAYCIYFILPAEIVYNKKTANPVKTSKRDILHIIWVLVHTYVFNTLLFSFLCHMDYLPFGPTRAGRYDERATLQDYFDPKHLGNCYFLARKWIVFPNVSVQHCRVTYFHIFLPIRIFYSVGSTDACLVIISNPIRCTSFYWMEMHSNDRQSTVFYFETHW